MSLDYEIGPIRPPSEESSLLVRLARNCPWNRCEFCSVYKGKKFSSRPVPDILKDIDTIKNMVGSVPLPLYELQLPGMTGRRSEFHGTGDQTRVRLPRVIMDLNRAHPVDIGVVDGIMTMEGGEGPWIPGVKSIQPGVLVAGKSALAVDAVATGIMGFDPAAEYPDPPFLHCDNHLNLARQLGFGTNRLEQIEVVGPSIDELVTPFKVVQAPRPVGMAAAVCQAAGA